MQLLSPGMLWGFAALAAPIVIHFWQRRRVVQLPFSTLKYLRVAAARTSRSAKLENILLLLLRCALFALLALAAARPVINKKALAATGSNVQRTVAIVLDRSLSMSYRNGEQTRLEVARAQALVLLESLKPGDEAAVFAVDDRSDPLVAQPTQDREVVRRAIGGLQPSFGPTNLSAGLLAARKVLAASTKPVKQLYLFTDNQAGGWQFDPRLVFDASWKMAAPEFVIVRPDEAPAANAALTRVQILTPLVTAGGRVSGVATVENRSNGPLRDLLTVKLLENEVAAVSVEVAPEGTQDVSFDFPIPAGFVGKSARCTASLQGDNLPPDDRFFFNVPIHQTPRVAVFEGSSIGPDPLHSGFYLRRALAAGIETGGGGGTGNGGGGEPPALPASAIEETNLNAYSAVFLADVPRLSDRAVVALDNFARAGGTIVYFPGDETDLPALARVDFLPATALRFRDLPIGRLFSQITEPGNALFANTWGTGTPFPPLPQHRLIEWQLKPGAQALVLAGGSEAFLMAGSVGTGRVYLVNASPDRAWGDFPLSPAFLPLLQQMALQSTEGGFAPESYVVGQPVPAGPTLPRDKPLSIGLPDGSTQPVLLGDRAAVLDRAPQPGFYQVGPADDPALVSFAVNTAARESDLSPISEEGLATFLRGVPHEVVPIGPGEGGGSSGGGGGVEALRAWLTQNRGMVPLWPVLLLLAAAVFAAESVWSNLAARNRAQGDTTQIRTGRLNKRRVGSPFRAGVEVGAESAGGAAV